MNINIEIGKAELEPGDVVQIEDTARWGDTWAAYHGTTAEVIAVDGRAFVGFGADGVPKHVNLVWNYLMMMHNGEMMTWASNLAGITLRKIEAAVEAGQ